MLQSNPAAFAQKALLGIFRTGVLRRIKHQGNQAFLDMLIIVPAEIGGHRQAKFAGMFPQDAVAGGVVPYAVARAGGEGVRGGPCVLFSMKAVGGDYVCFRTDVTVKRREHGEITIRSLTKLKGSRRRSCPHQRRRGRKVLRNKCAVAALAQYNRCAGQILKS